MNLRLIITRPAYNDMQKIFEYIAQDNKFAAKKLLDILENKFKNIIRFPDMGYKPKHSQKNIRIHIVAKHYQIVYTTNADNLYILRVLTGYQDISNL